MTDMLLTIFGEGPDLDPWQMAARAVAIFVVALVLIRISGRRSFGQRSPFDACTTVLLGAILSRAVVGASPFFAVVAASAALVVMHRLIALANVRWPAFERLVNGKERELVRDGQVDAHEMRAALISFNDLKEAVRRKLGNESLDKVHRAVLERDGGITIIESKS